MQNEIIFLSDDSKTVTVLQIKKGQNSKLGSTKMIQTYHFSIEQILQNDFKNDLHNCGDCKFSYNQNNGISGGCYTHKGLQYMGLKSMLKRLNKLSDSGFKYLSQQTSEYNNFLNNLQDVNFCRFGTYGEPTLLSLPVIYDITQRVKNWTGYTHQWHKVNKDYSLFFMASVHSSIESNIAKSFGYRSFIVSNDTTQNAVNCPASKEAGKKTICSKCVLCSGTIGKGKKDIYILTH